jgi:hypothetical protein
MISIDYFDVFNVLCFRYPINHISTDTVARLWLINLRDLSIQSLDVLVCSTDSDYEFALVSTAPKADAEVWQPELTWKLRRKHSRPLTRLATLLLIVSKTNVVCFLGGCL